MALQLSLVSILQNLVGDGKTYQWLKMPGSYGGKTGVFEYTKDATDLLITDFLMPLSSMKSISIYRDFLKEKGKPLSEINPGSDEIALTVEDALQALELTIESEVIISGGDILSEDNNELIYAYQLWGEEYIYLNWYCERRKDNESKEVYLKRSYDIAKESITNANKIAEKLKRKCYIVFVTE